MAHVQTINHLSLTIDHCVLRAHKFPFFNGQRYGFSPTLQKHRKKNHTDTQSISLANRVSGKISRASSNNTDSSS